MMKFNLILIIALISCTNQIPTNNNLLKRSQSPNCLELPEKSNEYFKTIEFPYYSIDSLTDETFSENSYKDFESCDDSIFQNRYNQIRYKYISLQDSNDFFSIIAYHQSDGENYVGLYNIDKKYNLISSKILFFPYGASFDFPSDYKYNDTIVNFYKETKKVFFNANQYRVVLTEYYKLKDLKGNEYIDKGKQTEEVFRINSNGMIDMIEDRVFEKKYVTALYKEI
jgi:hypothetical protein